jgi:hypothetical protein
MLHTAFSQLFVLAHQAESLPVKNGAILLDSSIQETSLVVSKNASQEPVTLITPHGTPLHAKSKQAGVTWNSTPSYDLIHLQNPTPGAWKIQGPAEDSNSIGVIGTSSLDLQVELSPTYRETGSPITLTAFLGKAGQDGGPAQQIEGLSLRAAITTPQGDQLTVALEPQAAGQFSALLPTLHNAGKYDLVVSATGPTIQRQRTLSFSLHPPCFTPLFSTAEQVRIDLTLSAACPRFAELLPEAGRGSAGQAPTWTPFTLLRPGAYHATLSLPPPGQAEQVTIRVRGRLEGGEEFVLLKGPWPLPITRMLPAPPTPPVPQASPAPPEQRGPGWRLLILLGGVALLGSGALAGLLWHAYRTQQQLRAALAQTAHQQPRVASAPLPASDTPAEERQRAINTSVQCAGDNLHFLQDTFSDLQTLLETYGALLQAAKAGAVTAAHIEAVETVAAQTDVAYLLTEGPKAILQALERVEHIVEVVRQ